MSYKTDRLVALFPDAYAAKEAESLLYKILDAVAAEFMRADEAVKALLKSHWVDYAGGAALDGLGAVYGVARRQLAGEQSREESDEAFRMRLKSVVPLFTGGGTKDAVIGAVRSALGLPFDLAQLKLPAQYGGLRTDIEGLIRLEEFSPKGERWVEKAVAEVDHASEMAVAINIPSVREERPTILWRFVSGAGRNLSLELMGAGKGLKAKDTLVIQAGKTLTLSARTDGTLSAVVDLDDLSDQFTNLDGTIPAILPSVPVGRSDWKFRARSGRFDYTSFDRAETFDLPNFEIEVNWIRYEPLTFDVHVPYFVKEAVENLRRLHGYRDQLFVYEGLPLTSLPEVVNQTKAAGVRGSVQFFLSFLDSHDQSELFTLQGQHGVTEEAGARGSLCCEQCERCG